MEDHLLTWGSSNCVFNDKLVVGVRDKLSMVRHCRYEDEISTWVETIFFVEGLIVLSFKFRSVNDIPLLVFTIVLLMKNK